MIEKPHEIKQISLKKWGAGPPYSYGPDISQMVDLIKEAWFSIKVQGGPGKRLWA